MRVSLLIAHDLNRLLQATLCRLYVAASHNSAAQISYFGGRGESRATAKKKAGGEDDLQEEEEGAQRRLG